METPFSITLNYNEAEILIEYQEKFRFFGLNFEPPIDANNSAFCEYNKEVEGRLLNVTHVPTCFILREENESKYGRAFSIANITVILFKEIIEKIKSTRGGGLGILPKTILELLSSEACRGMNV